LFFVLSTLYLALRRTLFKVQRQSTKLVFQKCIGNNFSLLSEVPGGESAGPGILPALRDASDDRRAAAVVRVEVPSTTPHEEHLLERMTMLENTLARLAERLEQALKLLLRHSETAYSNHALVKSLIEMLHECGVVDNGKLETMWRAECTKFEEAAIEREAVKREERAGRPREKPRPAADVFLQSPERRFSAAQKLSTAF
jgi:hypothetical protein